MIKYVQVLFYGDGSNLSGVTATIAGNISVSNATVGGNLYVGGTATVARCGTPTVKLYQLEGPHSLPVRLLCQVQHNYKAP